MSNAPHPSDRPTPAIVLMGVCGSGKTVVGERLAERLGYRFRDGDEFHPRSNVEKMSSGTPLTDADRWPWLDAIGDALGKAATASGGIIIGCSALKKVYRQRIGDAAGRPVVFVFLDGTRETLRQRLALRKGHFMPPSLLDSQLAILERPDTRELALTVSVETSIEDVVEAIVAGLPGLGKRLAS
jgi:gluconokinase